MAARARQAAGAARQEYRDRFGTLDGLDGSEHDLFHLAQGAVRYRNPPRLYLCCGTEDGLHSDNVRFRDHLQSLGLELTYEEGPGAHEWGYWDRQLQRVLEWLLAAPR